MATNEDYFKREDDRKWREAVDHQLVTLLTGHQVIDRRLSELEDQLDDLDNSLRGSPADMRSGVVGRIEHLEDLTTRLNAVIFMDAAGGRGMLEEFKKIQSKERRWEVNRTSLTAIILAVISTVGLVLSNWDKLKGLWPKEKPDKLEVLLENARNPKPKHRHYVIREKPDEPGERVP